MNQTFKFQLSGLTCEACEKVIAKKLGKIEGVEDVQVLADTGATSILASRPISHTEVEKALSGTHYTVVTNL